MNKVTNTEYTSNVELLEQMQNTDNEFNNNLIQNNIFEEGIVPLCDFGLKNISEGPIKNGSCCCCCCRCGVVE